MHSIFLPSRLARMCSAGFLLRLGVLLVTSFVVLSGPPRTAAAPVTNTVKLLAPRGYLPSLPLLVRVELVTPPGGRDRSQWNGEALLSADVPGVTLSTNRIPMRNGMGSALVAFGGGGDFTLTASVAGLQARRALNTLTNLPVTTAGGTQAVNAVWSGVVLVTNDVTVPTAATLTILSNTLVLINGVASGTTANDLFVNGTLNSLGTEADPVTITCAQAGLRWGQIRHDRASLAGAPTSTYRYTSITRAGRAAGEGHTGTAPVIRPTNARLLFESCNLTDHAETDVPRANAAYGTPGKIGFGNGSDLTFINCLFQRARMGPEIAGTALLCSNTWIMDMNGPDDADGIYIHDQSAGQQVTFTGCVIARGDDDGIDTLGSIITVENCIIREWNNLLEDAKGISALNGAVHVRGSLIVDSTVGISAKSGGSTPSTTPVLVTINSSTITGCLTNVLANRKSSAVGPNVHLNLTNCILWGGDPVHSDFEPTSSDSTNFTIRYSNLSDPYAGTGNLQLDPMFVNAAAHDFRLLPFSPSIDTGSPQSPLDPDGSQIDQGWLTFAPPPSSLSSPQVLPSGASQFLLGAYTNRNYVIEFSTNTQAWLYLQTSFQTNDPSLIADPGATNSPMRIYRARLAP
jgi:hypothetical protein